MIACDRRHLFKRFLVDAKARVRMTFGQGQREPDVPSPPRSFIFRSFVQRHIVDEAINSPPSLFDFHFDPGMRDILG